MSEENNEKQKAPITDLSTLEAQILEQIETKHLRDLKNTLHDLDNVEALYIINALTRKQKAIVFRLLSKEAALFVFEQLDVPLQKELLESFTDCFTVEVIEELEPDDRVELLEELPANVTKRLINLLSPEERKMTNTLLGYEPDSAGRVMTPKFISLCKKMTADTALDKVRTQAKEDDKETVYTLYVTDDNKKLEGVISLKDLLIADSGALVGDIMSDTIIKINTHTVQEEAVKLIKDYDLLAVPVVDNEDRIVGIITIDDAVDLLEYETTKDIYGQAGLADLAGRESNRSEVLVRGKIWRVWLVRLPFLLIALGGGILAATIIDGFEGVLSTITMVAMFMPLIMDLGGGIGTQSTTVFVRGVALGHIDTEHFWKHLGRETAVGLSIGTIVGVIAGGVAALWGGLSAGIPLLGLAVGLALVITSTVASFIGFLVPYVLVKLKLDQAAGATPIITVIKDITGLLTYFLLVMLFLGAMLEGDYGTCGCVTQYYYCAC